MKEIRIKISRKTKKVFLPDDFLIVNGENLQSKLIFEFTDEFVDGQARIEYEPLYGNKNYQWLTKENNTYTIPLKSALTGTSHIDLNLVITEGTNLEEIPKFVSKKFYFNIDPAVNAEIEQPDEYPAWIEMANTKLNQMDNLDIDVSKSGTTSTVTVTKKDGTEKSVEIKDATINGMNSIELVAGQNITITQVGNRIIISANGVIPPPPTTDIQFVTSDNSIFLTSDNANFIVKESD